MSLIAKDKGGTDFKPVPAGTHVAICTIVAAVEGVLGG